MSGRPALPEPSPRDRVRARPEAPPVSKQPLSPATDVGALATQTPVMLERIRAALPALAPAEQRVGRLLLEDARAFALIRVVADETELLTIATHPAHQRQGLARALMAGWLAEAAQRGARRAFLEVAHDNAPARALYGACGFAECGLRRGYYARPDSPAADAVVMARPVTAGQAETG